MVVEDTPQEFASQTDNSDDVPEAAAPYERYDTAGQAAVRGDVRPSRGSAFKRFLVFLFKLVLLVLVIAGATAVYFYVWPQVYARYIQPVENSMAKVGVLEANQQASQVQVYALQTQLPALAAAQAQQAAALTALAPQVDTLEGAIKEHTQALVASQDKQAAALAALAERLGTLESSAQAYNQELAALQSTQTSLLASQRAELERQVTLLKSMELLSRARLFLYQSNFGMAEQDIQAGRDLLAGLAGVKPAPDNRSGAAGQLSDEALAEVVQRLDLALERLPEFPVAASDDLDIAWQILLGGPSQPVGSPSLPAARATTPAPTPQATETANPPGSTPSAPAGGESTPATETVATPNPTP